MSTSIRERFRGALGGLSHRTRQWLLLGAISSGVIGLLWLVFATGDDDTARRLVGATQKSDVKPTNIDLMAPGQQLSDREVWMGQAGRDLERMRAERDEEKRIAQRREEAQQDLAKRFAELEARVSSQPVQPAPVLPPPPVAPAIPTPATPPATTPSTFPPEAALPRTGSPLPPPPPPRVAPAPAMPTLVKVTVASRARTTDAGQGGKDASRSGDGFLPVSFTRGILLGGLDAPTGGQSQTNPHPVLIQLTDNSVLPNRYRAEYRDCFVVAAGYGDISSERAYLRTESLNCVRPDGQALELRIQGSVYGEDGKVGMRGRLVTKQGQMLANALMAGVISGIGQGLSTANTSYSTSAFGTVSSNSGADGLRSGLGSGVGRALDRLAQYYIKLAEQTFPIIEIDAGREIDVVLTKGVRIDSTETVRATPTSSRSPDPSDERYGPDDKYQRVVHDE